MKQLSLRTPGSAGAAVLLFLLGLLLGLAFSFPTTALENRLLAAVEANGQIHIETDDLSFSPLLTLQGGPTLISSQASDAPPVPVDTFKLTPKWASLFTTNPGILLTAQLLGGHLQTDLYRDGTCDLRADNLTLDLPLQGAMKLRLSGRLQQATMQSQLPLQKSSESALQLTLADAKLTGLGGAQSDLTLGTIRFQAIGTGHSFKITTLTAEEGDFSLNGRGSFLVGRDLPSSRINLRADLRPTPQADPGLVSLLELAARKKPGGVLELRLSGYLSNPSLK